MKWSVFVGVNGHKSRHSKTYKLAFGDDKPFDWYNNMAIIITLN